MLCICSGEQFKKFEDRVSESQKSLATRNFSSSRNGDWESKLEDSQVDEAESTLKEALSLNYEEARALLGRLEYQRGNFDGALQVYHGIDIRNLSPRMIKAIMERTRKRKPCLKDESALLGVMSLHSVSLLLEAILLKAKSLKKLGNYKEAARECKTILDIIESALPNGMPKGIIEDCKLEEIFHKALEHLPKLWIKAGLIDEAISTYRRALIKPWNLSPQILANVQKNLASILLFGGFESYLPPHLQIWGPNTPQTNTDEAILLLLLLTKKLFYGEIEWDQEIVDQLTFALSICEQFELLAQNVETLFPGACTRAERWYFLSLCYSAAGQNEVALNLLKKVAGFSEYKHKPHFFAFLMGAKICSENRNYAHEGIKFASRVIDLANDKKEHFFGKANKFLGVCYGNAARASVSDSERNLFQNQSLAFLEKAKSSDEDDSELIFSLGLENALQRNLNEAFEYTMKYCDLMGGSSFKGLNLLALIVSAEQRFEEAETIVDLALEESESIEKLELIRLKAVLRVAQQQPKQAIEIYKVLLALIHVEREQSSNIDSEGNRLEMEAWQDMAKIYTDLESWHDAEACLHKVTSLEAYSPQTWHSTGTLLEAQARYKEAIAAFKSALSIKPDFVPAIVSTGALLMKMGADLIPISRSFLMNALRLDPMNHQAWYNLGLIAKAEGLVNQAAELFQAAYELEMSAPVLSFESK